MVRISRHFSIDLPAQGLPLAPSAVSGSILAQYFLTRAADTPMVDARARADAALDSFIEMVVWFFVR